MPRGVYDRTKIKTKETAVADDKTAAPEVEPTPAPEDTAPEVEAAPEAVDGDLCEVCWPSGWPGADVAASCEHGQWARE